MYTEIKEEVDNQIRSQISWKIGTEVTGNTSPQTRAQCSWDVRSWVCTQNDPVLQLMISTRKAIQSNEKEV